MTRRRFFIGLAIASIVVIAAWLLGFAAHATAETLNFKMFNHMTKAETVPIADVGGHVISLSVREGVTVFQNREWAWSKSTTIRDLVKGAGTGDPYTTYTFLDGSTVTMHRKGKIEATPQGDPSATTWTGDIVNGTGRFQGIKGTVTFSTKIFPPETGESGGKTLSEGTLVYTLPGK